MSEYLSICIGSGLRNEYVGIEDASPAFPAKIAARTWNGWSVPFFTRETAEAVVAWVVAQGEQSASWDGDILTLSGRYEDYEDEVYAPVLIDGVPHWSIGGGSWVWSPCCPKHPGQYPDDCYECEDEKELDL